MLQKGMLKNKMQREYTKEKQLEMELQRRKDGHTISEVMLKLLMVIMGIAFVGSMAAVWYLQTHIAKMNTKVLLSQNLSDVRQDISDTSDARLENRAIGAEYYLEDMESTLSDPYYLEYVEEYGLEVSTHTMLQYIVYIFELRDALLVDENGIVTDSTEESFIGFDMASGERSAEFLCLLDGKTDVFVQEYGPTAKDGNVYRKFAGAAFPDGSGFVLVSYDAKLFQTGVAETVRGITKNRRVGSGGGVIIADADGQVVSAPSGITGKTLSEIGFTTDKSDIEEETLYLIKLNGIRCFCMYTTVEGFYTVACIPETEMDGARNLTVLALAVIEFVTFLNLYIGVFRLLKREMADKLQEVTVSLDSITDGKMDVSVDVHGNREFVTLSKDINEMVDSIKNYMAAERKRLEQELEYAKEIQLSALPGIFPPYPDLVNTFDIYAEMKPAKEVGGDFYDFFTLEPNRFALLVADVSGKGIPAALFMMRAKSLIKSASESSRDPGTVFSAVNNVLCEGNTSDMFVTAWMGILDLTTGTLEFVNAGHNIPLLRRAGGEYEYLKEKTGFVLAGMSGIRYVTQKLQLCHGDELFLYTDGVPEATDASLELFGDDRLKKSLNTGSSRNAEQICKEVHADVDRFVGEAPQFDDMTLMSFRYL